MTQQIRITVLVENAVYSPGLMAEHGLAYWIECDGQKVLFVTGQGGALVPNAIQLGTPLREVDAIVLSHGHYDHTGGLGDALRSNRAVRVFAHPAALLPKVGLNRDGTGRDVGMPRPSQQALRRNGVEFVPTERPTAIAEGLWATGPIPRVTDFEDVGGKFFRDSACRDPDPLVDDQALFFDSADGIVVLLGCAHSGVINTLRYVQELSGGRPLCAVLGGMHLVHASPERLAAVIEGLRQCGVERLGPAHCTGAAATAALWNALPGQCFSCNVGDAFVQNGKAQR